ncbi:MAG: hypothetical protein KatS3mg056_0079 [Chloroflexus sp.]|nr:MAG: hypothetical protein KatS3mg056_0079 [Chloroflexus sp.]
MACAAPLLTAERISHRPREQRVRQKCPGSEMIAVFGVRQPCCRECSSGRRVSAGWRVPATLPPPLLTAERISHRPREQRVRQKCPGSEMIAVFGVRQPCCRECSSGNAVSASMACGSHAAASARPAMRSAQDGVYRPPCRPPPHRRTHLTPATRTTCTPKMPWQRNDCRFWSAAAMLPRMLVRQCGQRRMACTGHPAAPPPHRRTHLTPATRTTCTPKMPWQRNDCRFWSAAAMLPRMLVRQCGQRKYGVRQPCCRECSSGNAVSAGWRVPATLPPPSSPPNASHTGHANNVYAKNALAAK